MIIELENV